MERAGRPDPGVGEARAAESRRRVRSFALKLTGDPDLAEDVAQETLARVLERGAPADLPYLFRVALNLVRTEARSRRRRRRAHEALGRIVREREPEPPQQVARKEARKRFWNTLGGIPDREREALVMRYAQGLGCTDIAEILGSSPNAVSCLLRRGKERMRDLLGTRRRP